MLYQWRKRFGSPRPWRRQYEISGEDERYRVLTEDGVELTMWRVRPEGEERQPEPVMLLHGLGANHWGFDFSERSLARWLSRRGFDVWMPELRGHGESLVRGYDWGIEDYLAQDLPAVIDAILGRSGARKLHWVGHSMGGILLLAYGITHPEAPIERGITVASALDYSQGTSGFRGVLKLRPALEKLQVIPYGTVMHLMAPVMGRGLNAVERFNVWPSNIEPELVRALHARCFHTIPVSLLLSLASTFEAGGLRLASGYRFAENAQGLSFPILMLAGSQDAQVSVEAVRNTGALLKEKARVIVYGREFGAEDEYGHWDLLLGRRVEAEVWPDLVQWLKG